MHWSFHRDGLTIHVEARCGLVDGNYAPRIVWPTGPERIETFAAEVAFRQRLLALEMRLAQESWLAPSSMMNDFVALGLDGNRPVEQRRPVVDGRRVPRTDRRTGGSIRIPDAEPSCTGDGSIHDTDTKTSTDDA